MFRYENDREIVSFYQYSVFFTRKNNGPKCKKMVPQMPGRAKWPSTKKHLKLCINVKIYLNEQ